MTKDQLISRAQKAYNTADLTGAHSDWDEYEALVQEVAWHLNIKLPDAYELVENGPCIFA